MQFRIVVTIWAIVTSFLTYEYLILNHIIKKHSILKDILCKGFHYCTPLSPHSGKPLSFTLGWLGFTIICLTNLYIARKHLVFMRSWGSLQSWLNWHILCGLLGPTLIMFHTNFDVNGLVAVSFWSMIISMSSGLIGRYFYLQLLQNKSILREKIENYEKGFELYVKNAPQTPRAAMQQSMGSAFYLAGGLNSTQLSSVSVFGFLSRSIFYETKMLFALPHLHFQGPKALRYKLKEWALLRRRLIAMHYYKIIFGYWHAFHFPFAIFMYSVAVIHIISSLIFLTK